MTDPAVGPLDASWVARKHTSYDELTFAGEALWWLQSDPDQGGNRRLVRWGSEEPPMPVTPPQMSVGGWLHAYGGGMYVVGEERVWVVSDGDSLVYEIADKSAPRLVVPAGEEFVYGDLHPAKEGLLAVRGSEHGDELVFVDTATGTVRSLVTSGGFLAAPRLQGGRLAYLEWDADTMPWDSTQLTVVDLADDGAPGQGRLVAGVGGESVVEPSWGPDGLLYFLSDRSGWWNLYAWNGHSVRAIAPTEADCAAAPWEGGYQSYAFLPDGTIALTVHDGFGTRLALIGADGSCSWAETGLTSLKPYIAAFRSQVAVIGSSPDSAPHIRVISRDDHWTASAHGSPTPADALPIVSSATIRTVREADHDVRYLLHLPNGMDRSTTVPLLVRAHPGPTDDVPLRLDWTVQYFTSRGFAVAEVAYRGSTGQGRAFRQALNGHWGGYDVEDCASVAQQLLADGIASASAVFISGASAGGYTALQAASLGFPFSGATATSAIIDPALWTKTAPRFQRPHAESLLGPAGAVRAEAIRQPVLLIHGMRDEIAPVADSQRLAEQLAAAGKEHRAVFLDGVGHYLSSPASLRTALEAEWSFYQDLIAGAR